LRKQAPIAGYCSEVFLPTETNDESSSTKPSTRLRLTSTKNRTSSRCSRHCAKHVTRSPVSDVHPHRGPPSPARLGQCSRRSSIPAYCGQACSETFSSHSPPRNPYRLLWSSAILARLEYHEERKLLNTGIPEAAARSRAQFLISEMRRGLDDTEVEGREALEGSYGFPGPDDEHVVAAAVIGGAGAIVTANFADFPPERLPSALRYPGRAVRHGRSG